jgi:hypothetical protein
MPQFKEQKIHQFMQDMHFYSLMYIMIVLLILLVGLFLYFVIKSVVALFLNSTDDTSDPLSKSTQSRSSDSK